MRTGSILGFTLSITTCPKVLGSPWFWSRSHLWVQEENRPIYNWYFKLNVIEWMWLPSTCFWNLCGNSVEVENLKIPVYSSNHVFWQFFPLQDSHFSILKILSILKSRKPQTSNFLSRSGIWSILLVGSSHLHLGPLSDKVPTWLLRQPIPLF